MVISFDKDKSNLLKGIAIILVILHHYFHDATVLLPLWTFDGAGAMACSIFFFLSAYGLSVSGKINEGTAYWMTRIKKLLLPMIIANFLLVIYCISFRDYGLTWHSITDIVGITNLNHPIWFLQVLILMYLSIWISNHFKLNRVVCCFIVGIIYTLYTKGIGSLSWLSFPLGLLIYDKKINKSLLYIIGVSWLPSYAFYVYNKCYLNSIFLLANFIFSVISVIPFVSLLCNIKTNKFTKPTLLSKYIQSIGKNSIYPYLLHATAIYIISDWIGLNSWLSFILFILFLIIYTIAFSYCMSIVLKSRK